MLSSSMRIGLGNSTLYSTKIIYVYNAKVVSMIFTIECSSLNDLIVHLGWVELDLTFSKQMAATMPPQKEAAYGAGSSYSIWLPMARCVLD